MEDQFKIIIQLQGAESAKANIGELNKAIGSKNSGLTGAVFKANLGILALETGLQLLGTGLRVAKQFIGDSVTEFKTFEKSSLGIARTMDITAQEALQLSKNLFKIKTPTSIEELQDISRIAGSMGVAREDALKFVEAVDQINVALGDEFSGGAEQITSELGMIANAFGLVDKKGNITAQGITDIGNAINELGKSGIATGPYISDFTKRLGGIAPLIGISLPKVAGLAAALQELGQTPEVASTALSGLLSLMGKDLPKFAKVANQDIGKFSKLFKEDANEALLVFAKSLSETDGGFEDLAKTLDELGIDGRRTTSVLGVLSENTDLVRKRQLLASQAIQEGSSINKEFALNLDSLNSQLAEQDKKWQALRISVVEQLKPVLLELSQNILIPLANFLKDTLLPIIINVGQKGFNWIKGVIDENRLTIQKYWVKLKELWQLLKDAGIIEAIKEIGRNLANAFKEQIRQQIQNAYDMLVRLINYLKTPEGKKTLETLKMTIKAIGGFMVGFAEASWKANNAISAVVGTAWKLITALEKLSFYNLAGLTASKVQEQLDKFHEGGEVMGPRGANVPIMAQAGEYVIPADIVDAIKNNKAYQNSSTKNVNMNMTINNNGGGNGNFDLASALNMINLKM